MEKNNAREYALGIVKDLEEMDDWEEMDEYFADALDVEYTLDSQRNCIGIRFAITLGGPSLYVKCRYGHCYVECYWGLDSYESEIYNEELSLYMEEACDLI